jgi:hypothetical protein
VPTTPRHTIACLPQSHTEQAHAFRGLAPLPRYKAAATVVAVRLAGQQQKGVESSEKEARVPCVVGLCVDASEGADRFAHKVRNCTKRNGHKLNPPSSEIVACVQLWACVGRACTHKRTSVTGK